MYFSETRVKLAKIFKIENSNLSLNYKDYIQFGPQPFLSKNRQAVTLKFLFLINT